jgi:FAD/FMN-containing dehydrogenase/Fe-S oxidoreductase
MGGVIANNSTGAHSILYGMAADHIRAADVVLSDGSLATFGETQATQQGDPGAASTSLQGASPAGESAARYQAIVQAAREIRDNSAGDIRATYPRSWRNSAGYRLNYLLPWSASSPPGWAAETYPANPRPGTFNLAHLLAGSEGTLAVIGQATVNLVSKPKHSMLGIIEFSSLEAACDAVPAILAKHPSAIELIPKMILQMARASQAQNREFGWLRGDPAAVLLVEFGGDEIMRVRESIYALGTEATVVESAAEQSSIWDLRKVGLGVLDSRPQSARPQSFVEDCAVPVESLGEFVREMQRILAEYQTEAGIYGHASAGCLHIRPIMDLKADQAVRDMRGIAEQTLTLVLRLGGSMASEHGDGIARGEWLRRAYGQDVANAMLRLKRAADPEGLLSPKKMLEAPSMDTRLRYGGTYRAKTWVAGIGFGHQGGLVTAIEQCNGQGVCRQHTGTMCPSFQATQDEMHSTRGRANLLRALISSGGRPSGGILSGAVQEALDLCLGCKACRAECPSGVDMAKLKAAFQEEYFKSRPRPLRDYVLGYFHISAQVLATLAPLVEAADRLPVLHRRVARALGLTAQRPFPKFVRGRRGRRRDTGAQRILLLRDPFTHYVDGEVERSAIDLLSAAGFEVCALGSMGAGAGLFSKGFLGAARRHARRVVRDLSHKDPAGALPIVVIEPSELGILTDEYVHLVPETPPAILKQLGAARLVEEFLVGTKWFAGLRVAKQSTKLAFHPHCHENARQRSAGGELSDDFAGVKLLRACGYFVESLPAGCCGMAGTFGYEADHYELSLKIGEMRLMPAIRAFSSGLVAATGGACRLQIAQATRALAEHPLVIARRALLPA